MDAQFALSPGVYPASITPALAGKPDALSLARLLAAFEAAGCKGAVIAGTNGEGPSLAAVDKRDLLRAIAPARGNLTLIQGIATPSLSEAIWSAQQAAKSQVSALLVMPPAYFAEAEDTAIAAWFLALADASPIPILLYNFPKRTHRILDAEILSRVLPHPNIAGLKDSSGDRANLALYAGLCRPGQRLFVGDELLLLHALEEGWHGTISGVANVIPHILAPIVDAFHRGDHASARTRFERAEPIIRSLRALSQPVNHKAALHALGLLTTPEPFLPLSVADPDDELAVLKEHLGIAPGLPWLPTPEPVNQIDSN